MDLVSFELVSGKNVLNAATVYTMQTFTEFVLGTAFGPRRIRTPAAQCSDATVEDRPGVVSDVHQQQSVLPAVRRFQPVGISAPFVSINMPRLCPSDCDAVLYAITHLPDLDFLHLTVGPAPVLRTEWVCTQPPRNWTPWSTGADAFGCPSTYILSSRRRKLLSRIWETGC